VEIGQADNLVDPVQRCRLAELVDRDRIDPAFIGGDDADGGFSAYNKPPPNMRIEASSG